MRTRLHSLHEESSKLKLELEKVCAENENEGISDLSLQDLMQPISLPLWQVLGVRYFAAPLSLSNRGRVECDS